MATIKGINTEETFTKDQGDRLIAALEKDHQGLFSRNVADTASVPGDDDKVRIQFRNPNDTTVSENRAVAQVLGEIREEQKATQQSTDRALTTLQGKLGEEEAERRGNTLVLTKGFEDPKHAEAFVKSANDRDNGGVPGFAKLVDGKVELNMDKVFSAGNALDDKRFDRSLAQLREGRTADNNLQASRRTMAENLSIASGGNAKQVEVVDSKLVITGLPAEAAAETARNINNRKRNMETPDTVTVVPGKNGTASVRIDHPETLTPAIVTDVGNRRDNIAAAQRKSTADAKAAEATYQANMSELQVFTHTDGKQYIGASKGSSELFATETEEGAQRIVGALERGNFANTATATKVDGKFVVRIDDARGISDEQRKQALEAIVKTTQSDRTLVAGLTTTAKGLADAIGVDPDSVERQGTQMVITTIPTDMANTMARNINSSVNEKVNDGRTDVKPAVTVVPGIAGTSSLRIDRPEDLKPEALAAITSHRQREEALDAREIGVIRDLKVVMQEGKSYVGDTFDTKDGAQSVANKLTGARVEEKSGEFVVHIPNTRKVTPEQSELALRTMEGVHKDEVIRGQSLAKFANELGDVIGEKMTQANTGRGQDYKLEKPMTMRAAAYDMMQSLNDPKTGIPGTARLETDSKGLHHVIVDASKLVDANGASKIGQMKASVAEHAQNARNQDSQWVAAHTPVRQEPIVGVPKQDKPFDAIAETTGNRDPQKSMEVQIAASLENSLRRSAPGEQRLKESPAINLAANIPPGKVENKSVEPTVTKPVPTVAKSDTPPAPALPQNTATPAAPTKPSVQPTPDKQVAAAQPTGPRRVIQPNEMELDPMPAPERMASATVASVATNTPPKNVQASVAPEPLTPPAPVKNITLNTMQLQSEQARAAAQSGADQKAQESNVIVVTPVPLRNAVPPEPAQPETGIAARMANMVQKVQDVANANKTPEPATAKDVVGKKELNNQNLNFKDTPVQTLGAYRQTGVNFAMHVNCCSGQYVNNNEYFRTDVRKEGVTMLLGQNDTVMMEVGPKGITGDKTINLSLEGNSRFGLSVPEGNKYDVAYNKDAKTVTLTTGEGKDKQTVTLTNVSDPSKVVISELKKDGRELSKGVSVQNIEVAKVEFNKANTQKQRVELVKQLIKATDLDGDGKLSSSQERTNAAEIIKGNDAIRTALGMDKNMTVAEIGKELDKVQFKLEAEMARATTVAPTASAPAQQIASNVSVSK